MPLCSTLQAAFTSKENCRREQSPLGKSDTPYSCRRLYELIRYWRSAALPPNVNITKVYTDYMTYVVENTQKHLQNYLLRDVWADLHDKTEVILAHPNYWGSREQDILGQAAVNAKLISERRRSKKLHFVEEAEASASYLMSSREALVKNLTVSTLRFSTQ